MPAPRYARLPSTRVGVQGLKAAAKDFELMVGQRLQAEAGAEDMDETARKLEMQAKALTRQIRRGRRRGA